MNLLIFIIIAYGMSNILVHGKIFNQPRTWLSNKSNWLNGLINCMMCFSTWIGFGLSIFYYSPSLEYITIPIDLFGFNPIAIFLDGMLASGAVWLLHTIQEWFEYNTPQEMEEEN